MTSKHNRYYTYKDKLYYSRGTDEEMLTRIKNPDSGEWFDAVNYTEVRIFTLDGDESGAKYYQTSGERYYREVSDFKKKFKKYPASKLKKMKEIW